MPNQAEVVIVAGGKEHVFPPGFDPKRAAAIVKAQSGAQAPVAPPATAESGSFAGMAGDVLKGAGKGLVNTVVGLGDLAGRAGLNKLTGGTPEMFQQVRDEFATPTNTAQKIGMGGEQIAEFFLPGGIATRGAKLASSVIPKTLARAGTEALSAGAVTAAQGGNPLTAAGTAAAFPVVGRAIEPVIQGLRSGATRQVVKALGPTKEEFKAIAERRAPEVIQRGLVGGRQKLKEKATQQVRQAGRLVDDALKTYAKDRVSKKPIIDALEEAKKPFIDTPARGRPVVLDSRAVKQIQGLQNTLDTYGDDLSVESLVKIRRAWDTVVDQAGGYAHRRAGAIGLPLKEQSEAWAKREGANAIRRVLAEDKPDLAKLNAEYAFWKDIQDVLKQTLQRTAPQERSLLSGMFAAATAGGAGGGMLAAGGGVMPGVGAAVVAGFATKKLIQAVRSPQWRLVSAQAKNALADALASGNTERVNRTIGRVVAATSGQR